MAERRERLAPTSTTVWGHGKAQPQGQLPKKSKKQMYCMILGWKNHLPQSPDAGGAAPCLSFPISTRDAGEIMLLVLLPPEEHLFRDVPLLLP